MCALACGAAAFAESEKKVLFDLLGFYKLLGLLGRLCLGLLGLLGLFELLGLL